MDAALVQRIQQVYPTGKQWEPLESALGANNQDARISRALQQIQAMAPLRTDVEVTDVIQRYTVRFTDRRAPSFKEWIWEMDNDDKRRWVADNERPYPVIWMRISRVADYYEYHFNHWMPNPDKDYKVHPDFTVLPNGEWRQHELLIQRCFDDEGFTNTPRELMTSRCQFVLESGYDEIPDYDPRWEDDDFEPPPVPASGFSLLFGGY